MRKFTRRQFVVGVGATLASVGILRKARAAEFTYKYCNNQVMTHPMNIRAAEAVEAIKRDSNGRLEIQVFPNSQLGGDTDVLAQLRAGAVQFFHLSGLILATLVPVASINGLGFAWKSYKELWPAMDGDLGKYVRDEIAKANIYTFEKIWDNGFRQITSSTRPILTPADLKGFKIRVPVSPMWTSMFNALGAAPTSINFNETYSALQTKLVEGQENPLAIIELFKIYEVQKYLSMTNHMWDGFWILANGDSWRKLPKDLQEIVTRRFNEAGIKQRADTEALNNNLAKTLAGHGMDIRTPETEPFRVQLRNAGFYKEWKQKYGDAAWALLARYAGELG
ncbi:MAG: TRAP transporter substrate-binding protein [Candidatus Methylomirabilales bacterium]